MPISPRLASILLALLVAPTSAQGWARFRGPGGHGIDPAAVIAMPLRSEGIAWRVPVGGPGHSSPVLWNGRVIVTHTSTESGVRHVACFDAATGELRWRHDDAFTEHDQHRFNSHASATPAVDAQGIYLAWSSGEELHATALDHDGKPRWTRALGGFAAQHGSGTSPVVHGDLMIVANEHEGEGSFLVGLDKTSGEERWRVARESLARRGSYATPVTDRDDATAANLLFASTAHGLTAVAPKTGAIAWEMPLGFRTRFVAAPCVHGNLALVFAGTGGSGKEGAVVRMPTEADGAPKIAYRLRRNLPYVPNAIAIDGRFYLFADGGIVSCLKAETGDVVWSERLEASFFSSPVATRDALLIADRDGTLHAIAAGDRFAPLGSLDLGAAVFATPAIGRDALYVRTAKHLVRIGRLPTIK